MPIEPDDTISRCIIFSKAFRSGVHVDELLFVFDGSKDDGASHESGVLRRLAQEDADVHRIGCGIAAIQNRRRAEPQPGPKRRYYCGFRSACVRDLPLIGDMYEVKLDLDGEGGEEAHVDIALIVHSNDRNERSVIKAEAGLALAEVFGRPVGWVCDCDTQDAHHPINKDPDCLLRAFPGYQPENVLTDRDVIDGNGE